jgi:hypothetical protein
VRWGRVRVDLAGAADQDTAGARIREALGAAVAGADGRMLAARVVLLGETPLHAALARDPEATREMVRAEAIGLGLSGVLWLEKVEIATRARVDRDVRARSDAVATLMQAIEATGTSADSQAAGAEGARDYAAHMLNHVPRLRQFLGNDHLAVRSAAGDVPVELLEKARHLLLAMLDAG